MWLGRKDSVCDLPLFLRIESTNPLCLPTRSRTCNMNKNGSGVWTGALLVMMSEGGQGIF